jgi:hypothetical protein
VLKKLNLPKTTVISLPEFEDEELLKVKKDRTPVEYCWTCTPSVIKFCIENYSLDSCTYLDADLYFWSDPRILIEEMGNKSVLITPHRYTPKYDQTKRSGKYCVQFMTFKNDECGMHVLNWWRNACLDWCYARVEDGKFGDQKYLDDWLERFNCVHELRHLGGGVAPWNVQQYSFIYKEGKLIGTELASGVNFELIFYHFHYVRFYYVPFYLNKKVDLGPYELNKEIINLIYKPYLRELKRMEELVKNLGYKIDPYGRIKITWKTLLKLLARKILGHYNIYNMEELLVQ